MLDLTAKPKGYQTHFGGSASFILATNMLAWLPHACHLRVTSLYLAGDRALIGAASFDAVFAGRDLSVELGLFNADLQ